MKRPAGAVGIGVDMVEVERIAGVIQEWRERFLNRIYTEGEIRYCQRKRDPYPSFAGRFAAKEAVFKALGTGLRQGVRWKEVQVVRKPGGPPTIELQGRTREISERLGVRKIFLSLSHTKGVAVATVLLEGNNGEGADGRA
ncbi:MAG: holo-ACP synthase [Candidatus Tectomicrobia bacterium]|uniref:Holo-[acyl-carrier-protein] synthase n=1 Tax=Tectimicrobiota bacterium TaxID=2528274 RepID=A0A932GQ77_UNCTE|nr:holo-ACP synthase [Candidatus Tectomicrobia bacterium]